MVAVKEFPARDDAYADVTGWVEGRLEELGCPLKTAMQVIMCLEEIFVNIAHYAYGGGEGMLKLTLGFEGDVLTLEFRDSGVAFDPLAKPDPDITLGVEDRKIGGLGIYFVKQMMDDVKYARLGAENVLTVTKKLK